MRLSRLVPVLAAGALLTASISPVQAQTEPATGVGTTTGSLTLLGLDAGDLVSLALLTDAGSANTDEAAGPSSAAAQIAALALDTAVTDPVAVPLLSVSSTGEEQQAGQDVTIPANPLVSGTALPLSLTALVDDTGARSTLAAALTQLHVLGGVASLAGSSVDLGSTAATGAATGTRGVDVGALTVLDLEALLELLGISLTDLPLGDLLGLLDGLGLLGQLEAVLGPLGIDIDGLTSAQVTALLRTTVGTITGEIDTVQATVEDVEDVIADLSAGTCDLAGPITGVIDDLLGGGNGSGTGNTTCETLLADANATIDDLTDEVALLVDQVEDLLEQLLAILEAPLDLLSGQALLSLDGLDVTVLTKATDDVTTSSAEVTGTLGALQVGALPVLGALDLTAPTDQLNGLLAQAQTLIGDVLAPIGDGALSDLVRIASMQETSSVEATDAGGVVSTASFTGLDVQVQPVLAELTALLDTLGGADSIAGIIEGLALDGLPLAVPATGAPEVVQLNQVLASVTGGLPLLAALEDGLGLQVAALSQQSSFTPVAASPAVPAAPAAPGAPAAPVAPAPSAAPAPTLPRTGSDDALLLALAGAAVLAALGGRQLVRRADS